MIKIFRNRDGTHGLVRGKIVKTLTAIEFIQFIGENPNTKDSEIIFLRALVDPKDAERLIQALGGSAPAPSSSIPHTRFNPLAADNVVVSRPMVTDDHITGILRKAAPKQRPSMPQKN